MPLDGFNTLIDGFVVADRAGSALVFESIGATRQFCQDNLLHQFTEIYHNEDAVPNNAPKGGANLSPAFSRPRFAALEWRCIPYLWPASPNAKYLLVTIDGDVVNAPVNVALRIGTEGTPSTSSRLSVGTNKGASFVVPLQREHRGEIIPLMIWYKSEIDVTSTEDQGYWHSSMKDGGYWFHPMDSQMNGIGFVRNIDTAGNAANPTRASDEANWSAGTPTWMPAQVIEFTTTGYVSLSYGGIMRQVLFIKQSGGPGGYAFFHKPFNVPSEAKGLTIYGAFGWQTYLLGLMKLNSLFFRELSSW